MTRWAMRIAWLAASCLPAGVCAGAPRMSYLDNGTIRLGVDLNLGGSITYLADAKTRESIVNNHDWGRQIQMSFYSGPNPFEPGGKKASPHWRQLGWNPIQSGDYAGHRSKVVAHHNDGKRLYVKCIPMHWPLNNVPGECTFESWIELAGSAACVRSRINNARPDKTQYPGRSQELPAVYTIGPLHKLMTYTGAKPFTGDKAVEIPKKVKRGGFPWSRYYATENWAALVRDDGWGLGVWMPGAYSFLGGFAGRPGKGGPKDGPTGYISPIRQAILDHNIQYEYQYVLILGTVPQIRAYVYAHATRPAPPKYTFAKDRQHWVYRHASDTGWPPGGQLDVRVTGKDPQLIGPCGLWPAKEAPRLSIRAAFKTPGREATVYWSTLADNAFSPDKALTFPIRGDGTLRTYEVDLGAAKKYAGWITRLRIDPPPPQGDGEGVRVKSISCGRP